AEAVFLSWPPKSIKVGESPGAGCWAIAMGTNPASSPGGGVTRCPESIETSDPWEGAAIENTDDPFAWTETAHACSRRRCASFRNPRVTFSLESTVRRVAAWLKSVTGVPPATQAATWSQSAAFEK